jgi:hypothetical protein
MKIADVYLAEQFTDATDMAEAEEDLSAKIKPVPKTLSVTALAEYAGIYYSEELDATAILKIKKGQLFMRLGRNDSFAEAISTDSFMATYMNDDAYDLGTCRVDFIRDENSGVVGFVMQAEDVRDLRFKKRR